MPPEHRSNYWRACWLAEQGRYDEASSILQRLENATNDRAIAALVHNDLATLAAVTGDERAARLRFAQALDTDPNCVAARANLNLLERTSNGDSPLPDNFARLPGGRRIAIVSLLLNWPSTGGGIVHTIEAGRFLAQAGYDLRHFYAVFPPWRIGRIDEPLPAPAVAVPFAESEWRAESIQKRFRAAVDPFGPDAVIVTDSWNMKPLLAEAMQGYRVFLRLAAQECLCPLNNVRMLIDATGRSRECPRHQLATPEACRACVKQNVPSSGALHERERVLAGFGQPDYPARLRRAFGQAEAVLVVNPLIAEMVKPFANKVCVVPSGFDAERFPSPVRESAKRARDGKSRLFFAGLVDEYMKGFHVLRQACEILWSRRQDFELLVTADKPQHPEPFARYIGWLSQQQLPRELCQADVLVFPTVAQEALGRSAVEAMACGLPVVASRIGGLPFTVQEGATGLLFEPGDPADLAAKIAMLIDDTELRRRLGTAGRRRFEQCYTWERVIDQHYRPLLGDPVAMAT